MTKMQNFRIQGCLAVLSEQNDKLCAMSQNYTNLPKIILKNIRDSLDITVGLLEQIGSYNMDAQISDESITRLRHNIGDLAVNVAMIEIQIDEYRKRA